MMTTATSILDIIIFNIATPIVLSAIAIWIFTDVRKFNVLGLIGKMEEKTKEKAGE